MIRQLRVLSVQRVFLGVVRDAGGRAATRRQRHFAESRYQRLQHLRIAACEDELDAVAADVGRHHDPMNPCHRRGVVEARELAAGDRHFVRRALRLVVGRQRLLLHLDRLGGVALRRKREEVVLRGDEHRRLVVSFVALRRHELGEDVLPAVRRRRAFVDFGQLRRQLE